MVVPFKFLSGLLLTLSFVDVKCVKDHQDNRFSLEESNETPVEHNQEPDWMKHCRCVKPALRKMQATIADYTDKAGKGNVKRSSNYKAPALDEVIAKLKKIAHGKNKICLDSGLVSIFP